MTAIPPVLDVRDDLDRIRAEADADVRDDVEFVEARLRDYEDRADATSQEAVVDEMDDRLLAIEERVDGEARRRAEAARNRLRIYREASDGGADGIGIIDSRFRSADDAEVIPDDALDAEGELRATVLNEGRARDVGLTVAFYDGEDRVIDEVAVPAVPVDAGEQRRIDAEVAVPTDAIYYTVTATDV